MELRKRSNIIFNPQKVMNIIIAKATLRIFQRLRNLTNNAVFIAVNIAIKKV